MSDARRDGRRPTARPRRRAASGRTTSPSALGVGIAVFTLVSGIAAADHRLAQRERGPPRGVRQHPRAAEARLLHGHPGDARLGRVPLRRPDEELGARQAGADPPHHGEERQAPLRRLPRRRLHADAAARPGRRADALDDLLRVPRAARRHDGARDRPPAARGPQVPARPHVPGVRVRRRPRRRRLHRRRAVGDRAPLRAAAVPHPHQVEARARAHPRHVPRHRPQRLRQPRCSASPCSRPSGENMDYEQWSFIGWPLAQLVDGWSVVDAARRGTSGGGSATSSRSSRSSRSCRSRCCATCSRRR